jgi:hypothetical protein
VAYVAPELLSGYPWTPKADVYAFGLTVASMMSRQTLYDGLNNDQIFQAKRDNAPPLRMDLVGEPWLPLVRAALAPFDDRPRIDALRPLIPVARSPSVRASVIGRLTSALTRKVHDPTTA